MGKDPLKDLWAQLEAQGFTRRDTKKGSFAVPPNPDLPMVLVHRTESDSRADRNTLARLKRSGFVQKPKK